MKINQKIEVGYSIAVPRRILRIMKLTILIMTVFLLQVSALTKAQITLREEGSTLQKVLKSISKQSGYDFVYSNTAFKNLKPVTVNLNNVSIEAALKACFENQPLVYEVADKTVMIRKKNESIILENAVDRFQTIDVIGTVTDSLGRPLAGANVSIKEQNEKRATTDAKGIFIIKNAPNTGSLVITMIGYESSTVTFSSGTISVKLKQAISDLDEIRIIAYGVNSKRLSTSPINGIKASDIASQPVSNPILALQGRVPGLFITQSSGYAGSGLAANIQGLNSINKGSDPFYVIDGVPYSSQTLPVFSGILGRGGSNGSENGPGAGSPLSFINPADIESIDILKDADATAIYGSRAANGAILISTKKGQIGQTKIDITMQQGIGQVGHRMKMMNTEQYLAMRKEAYKNDGLAIPTSTSTKNSSNYDLTVFDQNRYTDWQKVLLGGSASYADVQASLSGGSLQTTFRLNGGFHRETTVLPGDFRDVKGSFGANINHISANRRFTAQFNANYMLDNNYLPFNDLMQNSLELAPNAPSLYNTDGSINWQLIPSGTSTTSTFNNPIALLLKTYTTKTSNLVGNLGMSYNIAKGLNLKTSLGYTDMVSNEMGILPLAANSPNLIAFLTRTGRYGNGRISSWIAEPQLTYDLNLNKSKIGLLLGSTFQQNNSELEQIEGTGFLSDDLIKDYKSSSKIVPGFYHILSTYRYNAIFARLNYNWEDKYIINLTARRDGSSRFGSANQLHNFGAIGAAWLFSNETFIKDNLTFLSYGKLRGSYGTTGNDQIGDYQYLNQYSTIFASNTYQGLTGIQPTKHSNPYLQWELTKKLQGGIDFGFLSDRLLIGATYYRNRSSNQLLDFILPNQTGFGSVLLNFPATLQNSGWEFTLSSNNIRQKNFTWNTNFNLTANKNKLVDFPGLSSSTNYSRNLVIGQPFNIRKIYSFAGVNPETGLYQFYDTEGKIVPIPNSTKDNYVYYDPNPKFFGGLQNTITYKNFSLNFLVNFVKQKARGYELGINGRVGGTINQPVTVLDRWQKAGDQGGVQKFSTTLNAENAFSSTGGHVDASYAKLKNLSISFTLPKNLIQHIKLQNCRVFAQGQNLLTFTNFEGPDPETLSISVLPPLRVFTFGVQISL